MTVAEQERAKPVTARERELDALRMRKAGKTFAAIGEELGVSEVGAWKAYRRALDRLPVAENAEELRKLEAERCDALQAAHWEKAESGGERATDRVLKVMERRARLLGLDAPPRAPTDEQGKPVPPVTQIIVVAPDAK